MKFVKLSLLTGLMIFSSQRTFADGVEITTVAENIRCVSYSNRVCRTGTPFASRYETQCQVAVKTVKSDGSSKIDTVKASGTTANSELNLFDMFTLGLTKAVEGGINMGISSSKANKLLDSALQAYALFPTCPNSNDPSELVAPQVQTVPARSERTSSELN